MTLVLPCADANSVARRGKGDVPFNKDCRRVWAEFRGPYYGAKVCTHPILENVVPDAES
jgi:hypothetical protein